MKIQPNIEPLESPFFVEVANLGQIGAGKVVPFTPRDKKRWASLPKNARSFDQFTEFEVCGDSLEGRRILNGDILLCRTNFEPSEISPTDICIIRVLPTGDEFAKMIRQNGDGTITILAANPKYDPIVVFEDQVQILALVVEAKFKP
jgi:SOS-response transcriptional repressor LexA